MSNGLFGLVLLAGSQWDSLRGCAKRKRAGKQGGGGQRREQDKRPHFELHLWSIHLRHSRASTTLDNYQQLVPESQRRVVERLSILCQLVN